jgi:hypothetical protein
MAEATSNPSVKKQTVWADREPQSFYANVAGFNMTPFDITLQFGDIQSATATQLTANPLAKISMSPELASSLHQLLGVALKAYTDSNGPLRSAGALDLADITRQMSQSLVGKPDAGK